jgi:hypothetical protein
MSIGFFAFFEKSFIFLSGLGVPIDVADFACSPAAAVAALILSTAFSTSRSSYLGCPESYHACGAYTITQWLPWIQPLRCDVFLCHRVLSLLWAMAQRISQITIAQVMTASTVAKIRNNPKLEASVSVACGTVSVGTGSVAANAHTGNTATNAKAKATRNHFFQFISSFLLIKGPKFLPPGQ